MSVEIKLAFDTAEEAIVALGKLVGIKGRKNPEATAAVTPAGQTVSTPSVPVPPVVPVRRPGRPRKATSEQGAAVVPPASQAPAQPAAPPPAAPRDTSEDTRALTEAELQAISRATVALVKEKESAAPAAAIATPPTPAPAAAVPTPEQVQAAVEKMFNAKDFDATLALLQRFGVKRGADLLPVQRADFINRVAGVLERGEAI